MDAVSHILCNRARNVCVRVSVRVSVNGDVIYCYFSVAKIMTTASRKEYESGNRTRVRLGIVDIMVTSLPDYIGTRRGAKLSRDSSQRFGRYSTVTLAVSLESSSIV